MSHAFRIAVRKKPKKIIGTCMFHNHDSVHFVYMIMYMPLWYMPSWNSWYKSLPFAASLLVQKMQFAMVVWNARWWILWTVFRITQEWKNCGSICKWWCYRSWITILCWLDGEGERRKSWITHCGREQEGRKNPGAPKCRDSGFSQ